MLGGRRGQTEIRGIKILWATACALLIFSVGIINVNAQLETCMTVEPWQISAPVGSTFTVDIIIHNVVDCFAWQVNFTFNPAVVNVSADWDDYFQYWIPRLTFGDFMAGQPEGVNTVNKINYKKGWFMFGQSTIGEHYGVAGSGWLATVEFKVFGPGSTVLDIASNYWLGGPPYATTYLIDYIHGGADIPMTPENCYFVDPPTPWETDLNQDGVIDIRDIARVARKWGWSGTPGAIPEDITGPEDVPDGFVDIYDLATVAQDYGIRYYYP